MVMYFVTVISFVTLLVQYIDLLFPDELIGYSGSYDSIRMASSILFITFPVFILSSWFIRKAFKSDPSERHISIRRWLVYLTLFVAGITMVVDLVQFVNSFYSGALTLPFFLKLLTVLVLSIVTFSYFSWDLRKEGINSKVAKILTVLSSSVLVLTLGVGFVLAGSPAHQRAVRLDEQRVMDLQNIEYEVGNYWREKNTLPTQLSDLERDIYYFQLPVDPETKENYTYTATGPLSFTLCAKFSEDYEPVPNETLPQNPWAYSAGNFCFDRTIDPDFFNSGFKEALPN
jgi:hypothetical protein